MPRHLLAMAATVALAGAGATAAPHDASAATGDVVLLRHERPSPSAYIEGAIQEVRIFSAKTGRRVLAYRFEQNRRHRIRLRVGRYRVRSSTRTCVGTCDQLDPPNFTCRGRFRAKRHNDVTVRISTKVGAKCRIRVMT